MSTHEPSTTAGVAETVVPSEQGPHETPPERGTPRAPHGPHPTWLRALRWLAHGWWKLFAVVIVGNFLPGAVLGALQGGLGALGTYLTSWGLLRPVEASHPLAFWLVTAVLGLLALLGLVAEIEERRASATTQATLHQTAREAHAKADVAQATAERALAAVASTSERTPVPQFLGPPDDAALLPLPDRFVGRQADLAWVQSRLREGGASSITALRGLGGIGKTSLAAVAVHQLQQEGRFPDGIAVVLCQGLDDPAEALRRILIRFDPYRRAPEATDLPRLQDTAQATLKGKAALVVLDNVEPELPVAQVVAPLRAAGQTVLLTARHALPSAAVPAEASRALDLLSAEEGLELFAAALGHGGVSALTPSERTAAEAIAAALGGHTLAIKLAGAFARSERRDLGALARELANPTRGLALPGDDETPEAVRRTFALSLDALPLDARRLFAGLAAFATPECGRQAVLALGQALEQAHAERSLHLLLVRALVEPSHLETLPADSDRERLRLHPLLWALAGDLFRQWSSTEQETAALAVARHLAVYAETHQNHFAALGADEGNLMGALDWAQAHEQTALVADLAHGLREFWIQRGRFSEGARYLAWGVAAEAGTATEERPEMRQQAAELNLAYGQLLLYSGQPEAGEAAMQRSLRDFRAIQDRRGEGAALSALAEAALWRGELEIAHAILPESLAIHRALGDRNGEGVDLSVLGHVELFRGQLEAAETALQQSLAIRRELGDRMGEGTDLNALGQVAGRRGQFAAAEDYLQQSQVIRRQIGDRSGEAADLGVLGLMALRRGELETAESSFQRSLAISREIGNRQSQSSALGVLGEVELRRGRLEAAEAYLQEGLAISRDIGDRTNEGADLRYLGKLALRRGQLEAAEAALQQSLAIAREVGNQREQVRCLVDLGRVAEARADPLQAEASYRSGLALSTERGMGPELAEAQLALGRLLGERLDRRQEGCPLLLEAARRFAEMGMPEAEDAREAVARLGCAEEAP
jgi:tetratricopeptide (TPR) repeat protein